MSRQNFKFIFFFILSFSFLGCRQGEKTSGENEKPEDSYFKPGTIIENIACRSNKDFNYTAFLPSGFSPSKKFPLIIIFDAHARGKMAVSRFKAAAENYGYIIVASNNARNGLPDINPVVNALWDDVVNRYPVDMSRVYTAGFSGGARIAASVAIYKGGVKGVIGLGGGMPEPGQEIKNRFDFISVVGLNDMNYQELLQLDKALLKNGFICQILTFKGGHEWPEQNTINRAVEWIELMAIKQKRIPVNDMLVRNYSIQYADTINKLIMAGESYEAYLLYNIILRDLEGIYDITDYKKSYEALLKNPAIEKFLNLSEKLKKEELDKQAQILDWYKKASFSQLKTESDRLRKLISATSGQQFHQAKRLLGFMGMLSFLYCESSLNSQNKANFKGFMEIYESLEPDNPDISYFKACQAIMDNQPAKAMELLEKAVTLGFYDLNRLQNVGYFQELRASPEFDLLLNKVRKNFEQQL